MVCVGLESSKGLVRGWSSSKTVGVWVSTPIIRIPDFQGGMTIPDTYIFINCLTLPHMKYQVPIHHV